MCKRSIKERDLHGKSNAKRVVRYLIHKTKEYHTIGKHNEDDSDVFGKREQKVAEVLGVYCRVSGIKLRCLEQQGYHVRYLFSHIFGDLLKRKSSLVCRTIQEYGNGTVCPKTDLFKSENSSAEMPVKPRYTILVSIEMSLFDTFLYGIEDPFSTGMPGDFLVRKKLSGKGDELRLFVRRKHGVL